MRDYIKRFLIAGILAVCVSLLFIGGRHSQASMLTENPVQNRWIWPADGVISDTFGTRQGKHKGLDIAGAANTPIFSVEDGVVEKSYYSDTYGNVVFIKHQNDFVTVYAHLSSRFAAEGMNVKKGEMIGKMGSTGQATGVHLHFEIHQGEWTFDKKYALDPEGMLGMAKIGEVVQAGTTKDGETVIAVSSHPAGNEKGEQTQPQPTGKPQYYTVKSGDTLWSISNKNHLNVEAIKAANKLSSDRILPQQVLIMPTGGK